ncbi:MAG: hypothetical protein FWD23_10715 [Oscillospiraceae bacterium]|nr:hypothetical protein [Oscillospiraceae bacterium]
MVNNGREDGLENDLFFVCSVIEHIGRSTKNKRSEVVEKLGEKEISRLLELADILHCEPIEVTSGRLIERYGLNEGNFDNVGLCKYAVPTHFDIAKVYKRLVADLANTQNIAPLSALVNVYTSWISEKIDDYNSSMYFENPQYLYASYTNGKVMAD